MTAFVLLPLLLAAADTGRAVVPVARPLSIYVQSDITRQSADPWFGEDKFKHFALSYMITASTAATARTFTDRDASIVTGAALGLLAGVGKEILDRKQNRSASVLDLLWDAAGVTVAVLVEQQTR